MGWLEQANSDFVITTGEGSVFKPNWLNATRSVEYNVTEFEFADTEGTLVSRKKPKGTRFNLEIFFQGDDHLDQAEAFRIAANDPRVWLIYHPFYGALYVQPLNLSFDNTKYNISEIKGVIVETITDDSPKSSFDPIDKIIEDKANLDEETAQAFAVRIPSPSTLTKQRLIDNTLAMYSIAVTKVKDTENATQYFNLFNTANAAIVNATSKPLEAIRATQAVLNYPSQFVGGVKSRIDSLTSQFNALRTSVVNLLTTDDKRVYENNAGTLITAMAIASITEVDYANRDEVILVMGDILDNLDNFISDLDDLQTENGGTPESYIPDAGSLIGITNLVNFTVPNLLAIALNSKQQRSILCEDDTNVIILAHRFYGLKADDSTIDQIIANNNIGLNSILQIRKGTRIVYYV